MSSLGGAGGAVMPENPWVPEADRAAAQPGASPLSPNKRGQEQTALIQARSHPSSDPSGDGLPGKALGAWTPETRAELPALPQTSRRTWASHLTTPPASAHPVWCLLLEECLASHPGETPVPPSGLAEHPLPAARVSPGGTHLHTHRCTSHLFCTWIKKNEGKWLTRFLYST